MSSAAAAQPAGDPGVRLVVVDDEAGPRRGDAATLDGLPLAPAGGEVNLAALRGETVANVSAAPKPVSRLVRGLFLAAALLVVAAGGWLLLWSNRKRGRANSRSGQLRR